jgi:hypothetical protein
MDIRGPLNDRTPAEKEVDFQDRLAKANPVDKADQQALGPQQISTQHTPSRAMLQLAAKLKQVPEIREEVLARVMKRMASGYYLSTEAAEETAEVLTRFSP